MERVKFTVGNINIISEPSFQTELTRIYENNEWVYSWIKNKPDTIKLRGRIPVYSGKLANHTVLIKRLSHGGLFASITRDRFISPNRLFNTVKSADFLLNKGVLTPEVLFITWQHTLTGYRCESGLEYFSGGLDASEFFFEKSELSCNKSKKCAQEIGKLVRRLHKLNFLHPDLNLMNFLVLRNHHLVLLDLDKATPPAKPLTETQEQQNLARLIRSVRKQGKNASVKAIDVIVNEIVRGYGKK
ncbi:hypothetical protein K8T06_16380 [bacterium]|nr:hypothetical protein [bacterium]